MGLWQRLTSWLRPDASSSVAPLEQRALPPAAQPSADVQAELGLALARLTGWTLPRRGSDALLRAYSEMPWLHAVVRRRAQALARVKWCLYKTIGEPTPLRELVAAREAEIVRRDLAEDKFTARATALEELVKEGLVEQVFDHPLLTLLARPNPQMSGRSFMQLASEHLDLVGEVFWGLARPQRPDGTTIRGAPPQRIWPIVPLWVERAPQPDDPHFVVNLPGGGMTRHREEDVVWIRHHDPLDPYNNRGVSTTQALGDELETDDAMGRMAKSRFINGSRPEVVFGFDKAPKDELKRLELEMQAKHQGADRAGGMHLFNRKFDVLNLPGISGGSVT